jgi:hypothetical protein
MIPAPESGRPVQHSHRGRLLDDADDRGIAPRIQAVLAQVRFGRRAANRARPHPIGHGRQRGRQPSGLFGGLLQQMKGEPLRRFAPDSR